MERPLSMGRYTFSVTTHSPWSDRNGLYLLLYLYNGLSLYNGLFLYKLHISIYLNHTNNLQTSRACACQHTLEHLLIFPHPQPVPSIPHMGGGLRTSQVGAGQKRVCRWTAELGKGSRAGFSAAGAKHTPQTPSDRGCRAPSSWR